MKKVINALIAATAFALANPVLAHDKNDNDVNAATIDVIQNSTVEIEVDLTLEDKLTGQISQESYGGSGIILRDSDTYFNDLYVLTCHHVLFEENKRVLQQHVYVNDEQAILLKTDPVRDLALLKLPFYYQGTAFEGEFSNETELGDYTITAGYPFNYGLVLSYGHVNNETDLTYMLSTNINFGQSGGPTFIMDNGRPEFIGINQSRISPYFGDNLGEVIKSDIVLEFLEDTAVYDDYIKE